MRVHSGGGRRAGRRRTLLTTASAVAALVMAASACSGSGGDDGTVELRFSWWGSDERQATMLKVIENFEADNPDIRIMGESTDWSSYWDRLATSTAASDAPDILMQEERYLREYADRGALMNLDEAEGLDLSKIDPLVAESGDLDGQTFGAATGVNAYSILADPEAFEAAGVEMPDDDTWTWADYVETAGQISEGSDGEYAGAQSMSYNETGLQVFARQRGENLYTEDGGLGLSEETVEAWFQVTQDLLDNGGQPDASRSVEIQAGGIDQSVVATNEGAMAHFWSNQLGNVSESAGRDIQLLRYPGETESERTGMFFKPAMFYTIFSGTEHPEEAARFVDYMLNDPAAADLLLADLGLPANTEVRESILDDLPEGDARMADFMSEIEPSIVDGNPPAPIGASQVVEISSRVSDRLAFGEITPAEAAEQFMTEVEAAIGNP
ncbi:ABC transporter substrate-binding protein [Actinorugispora endophytica]|uniref:Carbohydrate ABC transporter substrate-binding protein (CUT1 family) n=1 Tax=Actinorugispora endophytica TaxID=1605990 RepID=A0A4R6UZA0_9ACTN|nr:extracellular solute-binding protein [Actinorugispora endophytica]TDQ52912.1 carbohydrate ABC transporter substrate-binding protein (CUT1 family) [Actinorugispora endophytica]